MKWDGAVRDETGCEKALLAGSLKGPLYLAEGRHVLNNQRSTPRGREGGDGEGLACLDVSTRASFQRRVRAPSRP